MDGRVTLPVRVSGIAEQGQGGRRIAIVVFQNNDRLELPAEWIEKDTEERVEKGQRLHVQLRFWLDRSSHNDNEMG